MSIKSFHAALLMLCLTPALGCQQMKDSMGHAKSELVTDTEGVAKVIEKAGGDAGNFREFFSKRQEKPVLVYALKSIPTTCASGSTLVLGRCYSNSNPFNNWAPSCPSGFTQVVDVCVEPCPMGYTPALPGTCTIKNFDEAAANTLYDPAFKVAASVTNRWIYYGVGVGATGSKPISINGQYANQGAVETGVIYGPDGRFGYYTSVCTGVSINPGVEVYALMGEINTLDNFTGNGRQYQFGVGIPGTKFGVAATLSYDEQGQRAGTSEQTSIGISLLPISASSSLCDTTYKELRGVQPAIVPTDAPDGTPGNTFYTLDASGDFFKTHHNGAGQFDLVNNRIGYGWSSAEKIFAAEGGHVYAILPDGTLRYYHHNGSDWDNWGTDIGNGWSGMLHVWAGRFGEIYAVFPDGRLNYYKHNQNLSFTSQATIGSGWNAFSRVFGGGHGAIYAINASGDLFYYYHNDSNQFVVAALPMGTGWSADNLPAVGSTGNGEIYTVSTNGDLRLYHHDANHQWLPESGSVVGTGWTSWTSSRFGLIPAAY